MVGPLTNGQLLIGSTGNPPVAATLSEGANIVITPGAGTLEIGTTGLGTMSSWDLSATTELPKQFLMAKMCYSSEIQPFHPLLLQLVLPINKLLMFLNLKATCNHPPMFLSN